MPDNTADMERNEKLFDALLKVALEEVIDREMNALPSSEELNKMYPPSDAMKKRFDAILESANEESTIKRVTRIAGRVAAVFAIFFTVSTIVLMSVEASRVFILNTIINIYDDHVVFDFGAIGHTADNEDAIYEFVPTSFSYVSSQHLDTMSVFIFTNEEGERIILQRHIGTTLRIAVDNENREFQTAEIDGNELHIFEASSDTYSHVIMWSEGGYVFNMISSIDLDRLFGVVGEFFDR
ncbi:MAG: DUF4367 domain-containing protein [Defluviitaleaceae bacterium]|nr:DUF4367 domain-containing protein [Defluviitaleaceae bacterium]